VRDRSLLARAGAGLGLAVAYIGFARLGLALDPVGGFATLVWAPTGIALGCLARLGLWSWPAVAAGAFVANLWTGAPALAAAGIALGNTLEAVLGAQCLVRLANGVAGPIRSLRQAFALLTAALLSPLISASLGVVSLQLTGVIAGERAFDVFRAWWIGDVLGALVVAPVVLSASGLPGLAAIRQRALEGALLAAAVIGSAGLSFSADPTARLQRPHLVFPALIWAAVRFGPGVSSAATLTIAIIAIGLTATGTGPYAVSRLYEDLTALQGFMGILAATGIFLSAANAERAAAQQEREQTLSELRAALAARDEFLSVASHELRTPLTALDLQLQVINRTIAKEPLSAIGEKLRIRLDVAVRQVGRLTLLIEGLLNVSHIEADRFGVSLEEVDLVRSIRDVVERFEEQASKLGSVISLHLPESARGSWDPARIDQALTNLISNALKYGSGKPIEITLVASDARVELRVVDQGIGVAPKDARRIFERYERAVSAKHYGGLGLGLYIARQIVTAHGGTIRVESQPEGGASFIVELPRRSPEP
jgi:signal transduction histidine kinase